MYLGRNYPELQITKDCSIRNGNAALRYLVHSHRKTRRASTDVDEIMKRAWENEILEWEEAVLLPAIRSKKNDIISNALAAAENYVGRASERLQGLSVGMVCRNS